MAKPTILLLLCSLLLLPQCGAPDEAKQEVADWVDVVSSTRKDVLAIWPEGRERGAINAKQRRAIQSQLISILDVAVDLKARTKSFASKHAEAAWFEHDAIATPFAGLTASLDRLLEAIKEANPENPGEAFRELEAVETTAGLLDFALSEQG